MNRLIIRDAGGHEKVIADFAIISLYIKNVAIFERRYAA